MRTLSICVLEPQTRLGRQEPIQTPFLRTIVLPISQRKQEGIRDIFVIPFACPPTGVVSSKFGSIFEGDKGDSPINVVTLLMEGGSGVPIHLGIVQYLKSLASSKEVIWEDGEDKWAPLDVLSLKLHRHLTFPVQIGWEGDRVGPIVLVSNHRRVLQDREVKSTRSREELK